MCGLGTASIRMDGIEVTIHVRPGETAAAVAKRLVGRFNEVMEMAREAGARPPAERQSDFKARLRQLDMFDVKVTDEEPRR